MIFEWHPSPNTSYVWALYLPLSEHLWIPNPFTSRAQFNQMHRGLLKCSRLLYPDKAATQSFNLAVAQLSILIP